MQQSACTKSIKKSFLIGSLLFLQAPWARGQYYPPLPDTLKHVHEYPKMLAPIANDLLERRLREYKDTSGREVTVVFIETNDGYCKIGPFTEELSKRWGIGQAGKDSSMLIVVAVEEDTARISTGSAIKAFFPDSTAELLIRRHIMPAFKKQMSKETFNIYRGICKIMDDLVQLGADKTTLYDVHYQPITRLDVVIGVGIVIAVLIGVGIIWIIWTTRYDP